MQLQFVGSGDAFGSGGRFNTCFHLTGDRTNALIDLGASSLVALTRAGIERNAIDTIVFTHFHGDHFGGLPFFILDADLASKRTRPLTLIGPRGLGERYVRAMEAAFPSYPLEPTRFPLTLREIEPGTPLSEGPMVIEAFAVIHSDAAGPCLGYRITVEGKVFAYSGDTEWTETLVSVGSGADLLVCECYTYDRKVKSHTDYATLSGNLSRIAPLRCVLTHMSEDMLARRAEVAVETAEDGMIIQF